MCISAIRNEKGINFDFLLKRYQVLNKQNLLLRRNQFFNSMDEGPAIEFFTHIGSGR